MYFIAARKGTYLHMKTSDYCHDSSVTTSAIAVSRDTDRMSTQKGGTRIKTARIELDCS